jgi:2-polyprenyl-3-methyl-5-hydroxy-6-metoxy-1,4-benzoquinol methylase
MPKGAQYLPDISSLKEDVGVDLEVFQCSGCGLVQLSNDPVPYYREVIRATAVSKEMTEFRKRQFSRFVREYSLEGKKILEIGCGRGEYLSLMKDAGTDAYGIEQSLDSVQYCRENELSVSQGFIESPQDRVPGAPFHAFFILNYLEHLPDPNATFRGLYHNLAESAVGIVEVPNFDMILQRKLFSEFIGDHLFYFTRDTLCSTLQRNGFEVLSCTVIWHDYILSAIVRKRSPLDISNFYNHQEHIKNEISAYLDRFDPGTVAIWGAGHQALAIISMMDLGKKIRYVVDSASFKQGKFTSATHVSIVPPDRLRSDPVNAIVVMAASYSDEVAGIIREKYDPAINIAILRDYGLEIIT